MQEWQILQLTQNESAGFHPSFSLHLQTLCNIKKNEIWTRKIGKADGRLC